MAAIRQRALTSMCDDAETLCEKKFALEDQERIFDMCAFGARRSPPAPRGDMANLRYAKSGHRSREAEREARPVAPEARVRVAVLVGAVLFPAVIGIVAPRARHVERAEAPGPVAQAKAPAPAPALAAAAPAAPAAVVVPPAPPAPPPPPAVVRETDKLRPDEALSTALARHGASADDVSALVRALKGHVDVRALRAGLSFTVEKKPGDAALAAFELKTLSPEGAPRTIVATRAVPAVDKAAQKPGDAPETSFTVVVNDAAKETKVEGVTGTVRSSLYQALLDAGEDANLVNKFVDVFAWNVDFYRQTQKGDEFRVLVEKVYAGEGDERRFLGYGRVLAAEYVNAGAVYRGFLFKSKDGKQEGTYDDEGNALQRTFLKNPMAIANVTSSYGMRFHPVLGRNKAHEGIDYGAPIGTPVWTVADGIVREAHYSKTAGNMVRIEHMNGISTEYFHLSKYAEGIRPGVRVKQKQVIGAVGSTGLSTGPHLHFGMLKGDAHVDPSKQKFPNAKPVPKDYRSEFETFMQPLLEELKALGRA
jgi:murein DD-endopeptidase MepM/ murein hydrolase activator NlpD